MKVTTLPLDKLIPYARNPRKNARAVATVKASLQEFGWQQPIVIDEQHVILAGHTRYLAALELGWTDAPVQIAKDLTPTQAKAYRLMDNKSHERAEWDRELLALEIDDLKEMEFDLDLTGFDADELAGIRLEGDSDESSADTEPQIDRAEELRVKWDVKTGDIWICGEHRLLCGDSTKEEDVGRLFQGDRPHLMITDPPYGINYDADWRNHAGPSISSRAIGKVVNDDRADWREAWALFPGDVVYVWHSGLKSVEVAASLVDCGFVLRSQIIWGKNNLVIGRGDYHPKHEPCWYAVRKGKTGHWQGDRKQTTLWDIDKPSKSETGHSTQKPIECMARPMRNNSQPGDLIYEPFSGSGTTIIAGENLKRTVRAIEISPAYVAVALQRWADHTGNTPVRI